MDKKKETVYFVIVIGVLIFLLCMVSFEDNIFGLIFFGTPSFIILVYATLHLMKEDQSTQHEYTYTSEPRAYTGKTKRLINKPIIPRGEYIRKEIDYLINARIEQAIQKEYGDIRRSLLDDLITAYDREG